MAARGQTVSPNSQLQRLPHSALHAHIMSGMNYSEDEQRIRYNGKVQRMRKSEYPMLKGITYLDHAGTALPAKSLTRIFSKQMQKQLISNTHSALVSKKTSPQAIVDTTREDVLRLFNASPEHFEVIFTSNATAGVKLVAEALSGHKEGFSYFYHRDCHTSLVGVRELATTSHCFTSDEETETWLDQCPSPEAHLTLFAYPAQSNMNGRRLPLYWPSRMHASPSHKNTYTLLDIAALASTTPLNLSDPSTAPDFLTLSFYKIYGYPDLGALIVRKSATHLFDQRRYFGGGTTQSIACGDGSDAWVVRKDKTLSARLEDGTLPAHNILALKCAIRVHNTLYGGLEQISRHVSWLAHQLYEQLRSLRHENGEPVCRIYTHDSSSSAYTDPKSQGAVIALNIMDPTGTCYSSGLVGTYALKSNIHLRAGGLCNPAGMAQALGYTVKDLRSAADAGYRCGEDVDPMGRPFGMVRVSLGACSTLDDVRTFVKFVEWGFTGLKVERTKGIQRELRGDVRRMRQEFIEGKSGDASSSEEVEEKGLGIVKKWAWVMR